MTSHSVNAQAPDNVAPGVPVTILNDAPIADAELVARARRGDSAAFEELARRHYRGAYAIALAILGTPMDAEDACQEAFLKALRALESCRDASRFSAWLGQIVRNTARNACDARRVRSGPDPEFVDAHGSDDLARDAEQEELGTILRTALARLSEAQRQVVVLHDLEGLAHRDIGTQLGISEVLSRQHLFQARRALRARLGAAMLEEYAR